MKTILNLFVFIIIGMYTPLIFAQENNSELLTQNVALLAKESKKGFNILIAADLGRVGYYDQKRVANAMGYVAEACESEFVLACGDVFHYLGVQSVTDPLFKSNFEDVYSHPELQIPWYPVLGNHEYQGNTQAIIDYSEVSRRWMMPSRYYELNFDLAKGRKLGIWMIDTPPLIDKYPNNPKKYPDAEKQNPTEQLAWLTESLKASNATLKIVVGHHPIFADTNKDPSERKEMQERVKPILEYNDVDLYLSGHIHNHQHIQRRDSQVDYLVLSSASKSRDVHPIEGTKFCSNKTGFGLISIKEDYMTIYLLDKNAKILYSFKRPLKL